MSEPWRLPRHTDPIQHAPRGTTDPDPVFVHADDAWSPAMQFNSAAVGGYWPRKRFMPLAVALAAVLGPIGLFYVGFLNGIAALVVLPVIVPMLARTVASAIGGGSDTVIAAAIPILWCFTVPWAIVGVRRRNARIG